MEPTQKDVAERLGVSSAYVSQVLNGNFNFTLKKLIEIGVMIGKVPALEFVDAIEFWKREKDKALQKRAILGSNQSRIASSTAENILA